MTFCCNKVYFIYIYDSKSLLTLLYLLSLLFQAGTDGVKLCHDFNEANEHFELLFEVEAVNGGYNTEVLCQEFLRGKEYVIDSVS